MSYSNPHQNLARQLLLASSVLGAHTLGDFQLGGDDEILGGALQEVLGDDEILGAILGYDVLAGDASMVLGAAGSPRKAALARAVAAKHARVLAQRQPSGNQEQVLGFERATVTALAEATLRAFPQRTFRTERLTIPASVANFFDVLDLRVGRDSMFVDTGPVPAEQFSQVGVGVSLRGYTANLGNTVTLQVENIDASDQQIRASIIGTAITH